jgi:histidinol-phosphate aminotransferase
MLPTPRPGILDIQPYVGGDASMPGVDRVIRLASNENPLGPSPKAEAAYSAGHDELNRYPEGDSGALRAAIARTYGLPADRLVCGAGSDELISLLVRAYAGPGDEVLHSAHGFLMYPLAAKTAGATPVSAPERNLTSDVDALLGLAGPKTRLVFLANPNNPTGSYLPAAELERLRAGLSEQALLVIDAAYAEYVERDDYEPGIELVRAHDNVVMTRTFSKIHGLASLRLGWAFCPRDVADVLNRVRGPFNVSGPAQAAGIAALEDSDHLARSRSHNSRWLAWFSAQAAGLGLEVAPSVGNFVLLGFPKQPGKDAASAAAALKQRGILLRAMGAYGLPDCLRVTIGTGEDMEAVVQALGEFLS